MRSRLWVLYAIVDLYSASVVAFYVFARYRIRSCHYSCRLPPSLTEAHRNADHKGPRRVII
jgi:hypothetical protein